MLVNYYFQFNQINLFTFNNLLIITVTCYDKVVISSGIIDVVFSGGTCYVSSKRIIMMYNSRINSDRKFVCTPSMY